MEFVRRLDNLGKSCIYLELDGLLLGVRDYYAPGESALNDNEAKALMERVSPFLMFRVDTYSALKPPKKGRIDQWNCVFGSINQFLQQLTPDQQRILAETMINLHHDITDQMAFGADLRSHLVQLTVNYSKQIAEMDKKIDLFPKLWTYAEANIPLPNLDNLKNLRVQDTEEMTFYRNDHIGMITIGLLAKLLCPILGVFIEHCKKQIDMNLKDLHCASLLRDILDHRCPKLVKKFQNFCLKITTPNIKDNIKYIVNGLTVELVAQHQFAKCLVRNLVVIDFFRKDGNVMTYLTSSIRASTRTAPASGKDRTAIEELHGPQESQLVDEGNVTTLECGSRISIKTVDYPALVKHASKVLVENTLNEEIVDRDLYQEVVSFYKRSIPHMTPINTYLLGITYGYALGGAKGIGMLNAENSIALAALLQIKLATHQGYEDLAIASTIQTTMTAKAYQTHKDGQLKAAWNTSPEYRNCANRFQLTIGPLSWDSQLKTVVDWLLISNCTINLAPPIQELLGLPDRNGQLYDYPLKLIPDICGYIWDNTVGA